MADQSFIAFDEAAPSTTWYVGGDGILEKTTDGGDSYTDLLLSAGTPTNSAGDSPEPGNTDLIYSAGTYDPINGDLYFSAEWQEAGGDWRYWILKFDGVSTYTWLAVSGDPGVDPDAGGAPTWTVNINPDDESYADDDPVDELINATSTAIKNPDDTGGLNNPTFKESVQNGKDLILFDRSNSESLTFGTDLGKPTEYTIIIAAQWDNNTTVASDTLCVFASSPSEATYGVGNYGQNGVWGEVSMFNFPNAGTNTLHYKFGDTTDGTPFNDRDYSQGSSADIINDDEFCVVASRHTSGEAFCDLWFNGSAEAIDRTFSNKAANPAGTAYATRIGALGDFDSAADATQGYHDGYIGRILVIDSALTDTQVVDYSSFLMGYYGMIASEARPLGISADKFSGSHIWTTEWDASSIRIAKRSTAMALQNSVTLGAATESELDNLTYIAKPYSLGSPSGGSDTCFIYGRWNDGGIEHLVKTTDGGVTVGSNLGGSWGVGLESYVSEFFALNENTLFSFVTGASRALYRSDDAGTNWTNLGSLPFDVDSSSLSENGVLAICNTTSGANQVQFSESPFSTWTDASGDIDTTGGKRGIRWV